MELKNLKKLIQKSCKPVVLVGSGIKISETEKELYKYGNFFFHFKVFILF